MKRALLSSLLVVVLSAAGTAVYVWAEKPSKSVSIGMVALLAAPQKYDGREIQTWGYLHIGRMPEEDSVWLRKEDGDFALFKNSFALDKTGEYGRRRGKPERTAAASNHQRPPDTQVPP